MRFWKILILPLCLLLLAGCQGQSAGNTPANTVPTSQAPLVTYTVRFIYREQQVCQEQVLAGAVPQLIPACAEEAYVLEAWLDEAGNVIDPQTAPVTKDTTYTARVYPAFTKHVPYLFADEKGFVHPDDILTGEALSLALQALAVEPQTCAGLTVPETVNKQALQQLMTGLFPAEKLEEAMGKLADGDVTRAAFARLMNVLTGRLTTHGASVEAGAQLPRDLALNRPDSADVLEAVLTHAPAESGTGILEAVMTMPWKSGFTNLGGYLYYADENGQLLKDGTVGTMTFGADGCYTSGDPELDAMVAADLNQLIMEYPDKEPFDLLYETFLHCRDDFRYVGRGLLEGGQTGWEAEWAKQMFTTGAGNCYSYAAIFWAYARGLGYDAYCISGWTTTERTPHGWVEIRLTEGAEPRIFDPELAMAYKRDGKDYKAVWNMEMWLARKWPYYWP